MVLVHKRWHAGGVLKNRLKNGVKTDDGGVRASQGGKGGHVQAEEKRDVSDGPS